MTTVPHFRAVYPPGTQKGVARTSHMMSVYMTVGDTTIKLAGLRGITWESEVVDVDVIRLEFLGSIEVVYEDGPTIAVHGEESPA